MLVTKHIEIDMGHRVTNHKSKCASLHGHRYKIEVGVDDKIIQEAGSSDEGMVIDFSDLKELMLEIIDIPYDHGFVLWDQDPMVSAIKEDEKTKFHVVPFVPTAENLAEHWGEKMNIALKERGINMQHIIIWETPTSTAMYVPTI